MEWLINNLPAIILVLGFVAGYYNYLKDHDPNLASKIKVIGDLANYAVSLQATKAYSNSKKQEEATKAVMEQAKAIGIKVTEATAKGAVEQAVSELRLNSLMRSKKLNLFKLRTSLPRLKQKNRLLNKLRRKNLS